MATVSEPEAFTMPDGALAVLTAMAQTSDDQAGDLVIQIDTDDKPVEATAFADMIKHAVAALKAIGKNVSPKSTLKWAIIEAAICGDRASFTLRAYDKQAFKVKAKPPTSPEQ
jgi:hypothetical protein